MTIASSSDRGKDRALWFPFAVACLHDDLREIQRERSERHAQNQNASLPTRPTRPVLGSARAQRASPGIRRPAEASASAASKASVPAASRIPSAGEPNARTRGPDEGGDAGREQRARPASAAERRASGRAIVSDPDGIRTRVTCVKGGCPRPLDDGVSSGSGRRVGG
jgi:hypothetical protein